MKNQLIKSILLVTFFPLLISAQEFDESFLESLPDDVRSDLIEQTLSKEDLEKTQYRRPSSFVKKPEVTSSRYGAKIFSMMQTTLMPVNEPNFDGTYILDFGDSLELQLIGQKAFIIKLDIKRDGSVNIPEIGKVFLSGLSLNNAVDLISNEVKKSYIGVESYISLINVRDIQVIIAGNVFNPGPYTLNGNSNIFHALSVSGGPSELGSYRSINLIRGDKIIESVDLYKTFIFGKPSFGSRLRSGDIVFVNKASKLIDVYGAVNRPGRYELKADEFLINAIEFSNGLSAYADSNSINLLRLSNGKVIKEIFNDINKLNNNNAQDADLIIIKKHPFRSVSISGSVNNPGTYLINEGQGIADLVNIAGGYTKNAYPFGGVLNNKSTQAINEMALDKLYKAFLNNIATTRSSKNGVDEGLVLLLEELKSSGASGRVSAEFDIDTLRNNPSLETLLQDGDEIIIPEKIEHVLVFGEVSSEGTVRYSEKNDYKDYIKMKGGFNSYADQKNIFILHPNGDSYKLGNKNVFMNNKKNIQIYPGSIIFVPHKIQNPLISDTAQAYATILGNLGVSLASISVLKD